MKYLESINKSLHTLFKENEKVFFIGEDVLDPYGGAFRVAKDLSLKYPERVITTPISEASIVGFGTGLALMGKHPIVEIMFGDFITLISDQLINSAVKFSQMYNNKVTVPLVIRTPMGGYRGYGPTHSQTLESIFFNVPNLKIIAPSHLHNPGALLSNVVLKEKNPVLFIENKILYPENLINEENIGEIFTCKIIEDSENPGYPTIKISIKDSQKPDLLIVCYGGMSKIAFEAVKNIFLEEEICTDIVIPSIIKPIPPDLIDVVKMNYDKVLIVEESIKYSGWGAELSAQIYENSSDENITVKRIGAKSFVVPSSKILEEYILPGSKDIIEELIKLYNERQ
jgi:pyruvate/2-oxoglutarate/acetoin dehydrogenase E1 component